MRLSIDKNEETLVLHLSMNFTGCGKLGKTIARLLADHGVEIRGIVTASGKSAMEAATWVGAGQPYASIDRLPPADVHCIATPDDRIPEIVTLLRKTGNLRNGDLVIHFSGALSSDELSSLRDQCSVASLHFLKSFADPYEAVRSFAGTLCGIEGDPAALQKLIPLFEKLHIILLPIDKEHKKIWHAGSVFASNYLVTLHYHACQCFKAAGMDETTAKTIVDKLVRETLSHLTHHTHQAILTGPLQRGDANTVSHHLSALKTATVTEALRPLYKALGKATLPLTRHSREILQKLQKSLNFP